MGKCISKPDTLWTRVLHNADRTELDSFLKFTKEKENNIHTLMFFNLDKSEEQSQISLLLPGDVPDETTPLIAKYQEERMDKRRQVILLKCIEYKKKQYKYRILNIDYESDEQYISDLGQILTTMDALDLRVQILQDIKLSTIELDDNIARIIQDIISEGGHLDEV